MKTLKFATVVLMLSFTSSVFANSQLAVDHGCINCHGIPLRGEAPSFERLAEKLGKFKGDETALTKFVAKYRMGEPFEHIAAHERLSPEAATALLNWLAEGGK